MAKGEMGTGDCRTGNHAKQLAIHTTCATARIYAYNGEGTQGAWGNVLLYGISRICLLTHTPSTYFLKMFLAQGCKEKVGRGGLALSLGSIKNRATLEYVV